MAAAGLRRDHFGTRGLLRVRPRTVRSTRVLIPRLVRENPAWGYRRVRGELAVLGVKVAASTVWGIFKRAVPEPITDPGRIARLDIRRRDRIRGVMHEYLHAT